MFFFLSFPFFVIFLRNDSNKNARLCRLVSTPENGPLFYFCLLRTLAHCRSLPLVKNRRERETRLGVYSEQQQGKGEGRILFFE